MSCIARPCDASHPSATYETQSHLRSDHRLPPKPRWQSVPPRHRKANGGKQGCPEMPQAAMSKMSSPVHGACPRSGRRPALEGGWRVRTGRWEARLRAFSLCGFSRAGRAQAMEREARETGLLLSLAVALPGVNAGPTTAGAAKPRETGIVHKPESAQSSQRVHRRGKVALSPLDGGAIKGYFPTSPRRTGL
jgi:hypothetical protein